MTAILTATDQATPPRLTAILLETGVLPQGEVLGVERRANEAFNSSIAHLTLTYTAMAPPAAPRQVLLKLNADGDGEHEVAFYRLVAELAAPLPMLVPCYAAAYDPASGASHILLADLSATHAAPVTRAQVLSGAGLPSDAHLAGIVDALARFHAYWWEHPRLGQGATAVRGWYTDAAAYAAHVRRREANWAAFSGSVGAGFPADLRALYTRVLARLPALWEPYLAPRVTACRQLTLSNGDCYFAQFLCPIAAGGPTYIVDFQDVSANFAPYDLVYLFATFWTPAQRHEGGREARLLRRYHAELCAAGVRGYPWEQLLLDYRLMILFMIFDPVWNQTAGSPESYWWPKLQCLTAAFNDLDCAGLLPP